MLPELATTSLAVLRDQVWSRLRTCPLRSKPSRSAARSTSTKRNWCARGFARIGYRDAGEGEAADLCVVNTCTVTAEGDSKSRQAIRRLARENPQARIVVMGCYATRAPEELAKLPNVAEVRDRQAGNSRSAGPLRRGRHADGHFAISAIATGRLSRCRTAASCGAATASFPMCGRTCTAGRWSTCSRKCGGWSITAIARSC